MISFVEGPFDDEPVFSFLARCYERLVGPTRAQFAKHIFGNDRFVASFDFPCMTDAVAERLSRANGVTSDELIEMHSMFPLAAFLMPKERVDAVRAAMKSTVGLRTNPIKWKRDDSGLLQRRLKFCRICRERDLRETGTTWWRRTLQAPGIVCCPIHAIPLEQSQFVRAQLWKSDYPHAIDAVSFCRDIEPDGIDILYARDVKWLLGHPPQAIDPGFLQRLYSERLAEKGLLERGRLRRTEFLERFHSQRSEAEWRKRGLSFNSRDYSAWPAVTVRAKANHGSFRMHLLVAHFLGLSIADLRNLAVELGQKAAIRARRRKAWLRVQIRRKWTDPKWNLLALSKSLGISRGRIVRMAYQEGLSLPKCEKVQNPARFRKKRSLHRTIFIGGEANASEKQWIAAVRWLNLYDRSWMATRRKNRPAGPVGRHFIDWDERQRRYLAMLPIIAVRVRAERPFRRVCAASLISHLPIADSAEQYLETKMPRLGKVISRMTESHGDFTMRRIQVIRQLHPNWSPFLVREKAAVPRDCREPKMLKAMGYELFGGRWCCKGNLRNPLYGLGPSSGGSA